MLVCAPTGTGETVVGGVRGAPFALTAGTTCFYITPITTLSNHTHTDLVAWHGAENVGLFTGDTSGEPEVSPWW